MAKKAKTQRLNPGGRTLSAPVFAEFDRLMANNGGLLHPRAVVAAARNPNSILHNLFTWDDVEAAEKWRIAEARSLIGSYEIFFEEQNISVRALTSIDMDRAFGGGYRWTNDVMQRADLRQEMIRSALKELKAAESKYKHIQELASIWGAVDEAEASAMGKSLTDQDRDSQGRFA